MTKHLDAFKLDQPVKTDAELPSHRALTSLIKHQRGIAIGSFYLSFLLLCGPTALVSLFAPGCSLDVAQNGLWTDATRACLNEQTLYREAFTPPVLFAALVGLAFFAMSSAALLAPQLRWGARPLNVKEAEELERLCKYFEDFGHPFVREHVACVVAVRKLRYGDLRAVKQAVAAIVAAQPRPVTQTALDRLHALKAEAA